jgi:hypothetical protein
MSTITILEKAYGRYSKSAIRSLKQTLTELCAGLKADISGFGRTERGWIQIKISGEDEAVLTKCLERDFGLAPVTIDGIDAKSTIRGKIIESGQIGYGLYVDIGMFSPEIRDALYPLYKMRLQLAKGKKISVNQIIEKFCLLDNFPIEVFVEKIDLEKKEIEVELSKKQLSIFRDWISSQLDRVIVLGATRAHVKTALLKTRHFQDINEIQRLGLLEHAIICKKGTYAPGIISKIGPLLPQTPLYAFHPKEAEKLMLVE